MSDTVKGSVHCLCCDQFIPRKREREHRRQAANPFITTTNPEQPKRRSVYLTALLDSPSDSAIEDEDQSQHSPEEELHPKRITEDVKMFDPPPLLPATPRSPGDFGMPEDDNMALDTVGDEDDVDKVLSRHWKKPLEHQWAPSDSEEDPANTENEGSSEEVVAEDDDDEVDVVDWDALEQECGLSAWDRLGEGYEANAAQIGSLSCYSVFFVLMKYLQRKSLMNMTGLSVGRSHTKSPRTQQMLHTKKSPSLFKQILLLHHSIHSAHEPLSFLVLNLNYITAVQTHAVAMLGLMRTSRFAHFAKKIDTEQTEKHLAKFLLIYQSSPDSRLLHSIQRLRQ